MHRVSAAVLPLGNLTYCQVRLHRPPVRATTLTRRLERWRRKFVTDAGLPDQFINERSEVGNIQHIATGRNTDAGRVGCAHRELAVRTGALNLGA